MKNNIFHCSITRAGTTMFNNLFSGYRFPFEYSQLHFNQLISVNGKFIVPPKTIVSHVTNIKYSEFFEKLEMETYDVKGFYICRDPRDVIVSSYWSWLESHPGGHPERENIRNVSKEEAMNYIIDSYRHKFEVMYDWVVNCKDERFKVIKFEELFENEDDQIVKMIDLFKFLEIDKDEEEMIEIFKKKSLFSSGLLGGRKAGSKIINKHHYRAGVSTFKKEMPKGSLQYLYEKMGIGFVENMGYQI